MAFFRRFSIVFQCLDLRLERSALEFAPSTFVVVFCVKFKNKEIHVLSSSLHHPLPLSPHPNLKIIHHSSCETYKNYILPLLIRQYLGKGFWDIVRPR